MPTRSALIQLIEWCPRWQRRSSPTQRDVAASTQTDLAISDLPSRPSGPATPKVHRSLQPEIRQAEPWRQAWLLDADAQQDPARIERLTR